MKKVLLVMCFLGATNLFADNYTNFCSSVVFQKNSAYVKADAVPVLQLLCHKYRVLEPDCALVDFRSDGSAWIVEAHVEDFHKYCYPSVVNQPAEPETGWFESFIRASSNVNFHH